MQQQEKAILFCTERCVEGHRLVYTLFQSGEGYGLAVTANGVTAEAPDLFPDARTVKALLLRLADGTVFPETLYEILDDLLGTEVW